MRQHSSSASNMPLAVQVQLVQFRQSSKVKGKEVKLCEGSAKAVEGTEYKVNWVNTNASNSPFWDLPRVKAPFQQNGPQARLSRFKQEKAMNVTLTITNRFPYFKQRTNCSPPSKWNLCPFYTMWFCEGLFGLGQIHWPFEPHGFLRLAHCL